MMPGLSQPTCPQKAVVDSHYLQFEVLVQEKVLCQQLDKEGVAVIRDEQSGHIVMLHSLINL